MFPNLKLAMIYCTEMEKLLNILKLEVSSKKKKKIKLVKVLTQVVAQTQRSAG